MCSARVDQCAFPFPTPCVANVSQAGAFPTILTRGCHMMALLAGRPVGGVRTASVSVPPASDITLFPWACAESAGGNRLIAVSLP